MLICIDDTHRSADYIYDDDDDGQRGGLGSHATQHRFIVLGDLNADPIDVDSTDQAALKQGGPNRQHRGNHRHDTADFSERGPGNLRVDYVQLSEYGLEVVCSRVSWPTAAQTAELKVGASSINASDHRMVYVDLRPTD